MAFIGGKKDPLYALEFLTTTPDYPVGSRVSIVVPYIEIGRAGTCAIRFSEAVRTVSRKHAALERRGDDIILYNLSATNPTLVNGSPVEKTWTLNHGDEFQLSYEGPRLRFSTASARAFGAGATNRMGMTKRIGLVVNQAVRPYRTALWITMLLLLVGGLVVGYFMYQLDGETEQWTDETIRLRESNTALSDSLVVAIRANEQLKQTMLADRKQMEARLQTTISEVVDRHQKLAEQIKRPDPKEAVAAAIDKVKGSVFYMGIKRITAKVEGDKLVDIPIDENCHCTGFLLNDGRFVTARHCIEGHYYEKNELNLMITFGGEIIYDLFAISSDGSTRFDFSSKDFVVKRTTDYYVRDEYNGKKVVLRQAKGYDGTDWAYLQTDRKGAIQAAPELSDQLKSGTELHCLGYTYGNAFRALSSERGLDVLYSKATVAKDNLDNNTIIVSGYGFDNGNSGSPLFVVRNGLAQAVAIVSASYINPSTGRDDALGSVVPIKNIY